MYEAVLQSLRTGGAISHEQRAAFAADVFRRTSAYDAEIDAYLRGQSDCDDTLPKHLSIDATLTATLRYGENHHQVAGLYVGSTGSAG